MPLLFFMLIGKIIKPNLMHQQATISNSEMQEFIQKHLTDDVRQLALQANKYPEMDMPFVLQQIAGRQRVKDKLPTWCACPQAVFPPQINLEQCSSELTAQYKISWLREVLSNGAHCHSFVDLTGGFGVDTFTMASLFQQGYYVERNEELFSLVAHNATVMGKDNLSLHSMACEDYLATMPTVTLCFIDPARRSVSGQKVAALEDCTPDVLTLLPVMTQKSEYVLLKLSPMLDVKAVLRALKGVSQVAVVSLHNECKELLVLIDSKDYQHEVVTEDKLGCVPLAAVNIINSGVIREYKTTYADEANQPLLTYNDEPETLEGQYLFEPNTSVMKIGAFASLTANYPVRQLSQSAHLFVTNTNLTEFPGRHFRIEKVCKVQKKEVQKMMGGASQCHLTVRDFPDSVANLRKKLKLKEGGDIYLFATTVGNEKRLLRCTKV